MGRVTDWRARYEVVIDTIRSNPFRWDRSDCLSGLTVPVLEAITGERMFSQYRGKYKTAKGALGVMKRSGFDNLADLVASELPEIHPSECRIGDIAAIPTDDSFGYSLGVVNGDRVFVMHETGLGTRDMSEVKRAFRVI